MNLNKLFQEVDALRVTWDDLFGRVRVQWDAFEQPMPGLNGLSAHDLDISFRFAVELLLSVRPDDENRPEYSILWARQQDIRMAISGLVGQLNEWVVHFRAQWSESTRIVSLDGEFHWRLENGDDSISEANVTSIFRSLVPQVSTLMSVVGQTVPLCRGDSIKDLAKRTEAFAKLLADIQPLYSQAKSNTGRSKIAADKSEVSTSEIQILAKQAAEDLARLRELLSQVTTDHGQVTAQTERVQQITLNAETLALSVTQFQAKFDDFKSAMDERMDEFDEFENRSREADLRNENYEKTINSLIAQSDEMLKGSTTVGLAKSMEDTRLRYEKRMSSTRLGFYFSVAFLLVSALPLAIHLVPGLVELLPWFVGKNSKPMPALDTSGDGSPYAVLGKMVILLPATWLTAFFSRSYANLFQLEREYAHKAALAGSVHGFKLQAKKYEEEITAEVFMEIRMNPARGPEVDAASHPLYDVLAKVVAKGLEKFGGNAGEKA